MLPPPRLAQLVAIGVSALLVMVAGLVAGLAGRDPVVAEPPPAAAAPVAQPVEPPLRVLAGDRLAIGSAVNVDALADPRYRAVLGREFNAVTAEQAMKWSAVEPAKGRYDRAAADRLIVFAQQHDQRVYGHALVWHKQVPGWVTDTPAETPASRPATGELLRRHVEDEVSYFRGRVWAWDVVNEPLADDGTLRQSIWLRQLGPGYLADAFRWARAADPQARLFLNEYGVEGVNPKSDALYALVRDLRAAGVPIDGVGFQVHWTLDPLPSSFTDNLARFAALGVDVAITELDTRMPVPATPERLRRQAAVYQQAIGACLAVPRCVSFTVWGFTDAYSWVPGAHPGLGAATMFDQNLIPKPAYGAVAGRLRIR